MTAESPLVLVVGGASRDLVADDPRGWRLGGAVAFASLALARYGFEVRAVVGADDEAAAASELGVLRAAGVRIEIAHLASGPVFDNLRHVLHAAADRVPLTALPRGWTTGIDGVLFVPVAAELGDEWASVAAARPAPLVGLGWQGMLRFLAAGERIRPAPPFASPLVLAARVVVLSREDVTPGTQPDDLVPFLDSSATLVITEGADGGRVVGPDERGRRAYGRYPAIPSDGIVDPTGAGDVFLAAWLAATISPSIAETDDALVFAAAAGSLALEGLGLAGVADLAAVRARMTRVPSLASRRPSAVSSRTRGRPSQA